MAIERLIAGSVRDQIRELIATEDLLIESLRDLVKDEMKSHIKTTIDADEELKSELQEVMRYYFDAKARSLFAEVRASRAAARLGLAILPEDVRDDLGEALVGLFERELSSVLDRAL